MTDQKTNMTTTICPNCQKRYKILSALLGKSISCKNCSQKFTMKEVAHPHQLPDICKVALFQKILTREQVDDVVAAFQLLNKAGSTLKFDLFFLSCGLLDSDQKTELEDLMENLRLRRLGGRFCTIAIERGFISQEIADAALARQARQFNEHQVMELVGDILVNDGVITLEQRNQIFVQQKRISQEIDAATSISQSPFPDEKKESNMDDPSVDKGSASSEEKKIVDEESEKTDRTSDKEDSDTLPNERLKLIVSDDQCNAVIRISSKASDPSTSATVTLEEVKKVLDDAGIIYGVREDGVIDHFLTLAENNAHSPVHELVVAEGVPAQHGKNAELNCNFDTDYLKAGSKKENGSIDFMDRGERPFVSKGDLLVNKIPMAPASPGVDVFGYPIEVEPVWDIPLRCGKGAEFSEDKLTATATRDGEPRLSFDGMVSVLSEQRISGNIGLKTGHVYFDGNVVVGNAVQSGAKVKCANLSAAVIEDAEIEAGGDVRVAGGITGAVIRTEGRVFAKYISKSKIDAFGDVTAEKEIIDSNIQTNGACRVISGSIITSKVTAKQGIETVNIGTETSSPCLLNVGGDDHLESEIAMIKEDIAVLKEEMKAATLLKNQLDRENQELDQKVVSLAHVQDRGQLDIKALDQKLTALIPPITDGADPTPSKKMDHSSLTVEELSARIADGVAKDLKQEAMEILEQIQALRDTVKTAKSDLDSCFERQDRIQEAIETADEKFESAENKKTILDYKKEILTKRFKGQKGQCRVVARKNIYPGSVVNGNNSRLVVDSILKNVTLKEIKRRRSENEPERWEMAVRQNR